VTGQPTVSCLCPTYGRFPDHADLLAEAVESFRWQDYPIDRRELVILNDCATQIITCDAPGVRVVNVPWRYPTLGQKFDAICALALGDIFLPWEDDDISLPHRITQAVERIGDPAKPRYFNPGCHWLHSLAPAGEGDYAGGFRLMRSGVNHNASAFTRTAWRAVGGYPARTGDQDAAMDSLLRMVAEVVPPLGKGEPPGYVYCWGRSDCHLSGYADMRQGWELVGSRPVTPGGYAIFPSPPQFDYASMVAAALPGL
jgi:hypothetical protein